MQDNPDELLRPACFGDLCIIWSPHTYEDSDISLDERAQGNPLVVTKLLECLQGSRVLECYSKQRNASHTKQGEAEALDYEYVNKLLFRRATVT